MGGKSHVVGRSVSGLIVQRTNRPSWGLSFCPAALHFFPRKNVKGPGLATGAFLFGILAMTYFLTGNPQYHRRGVVSRSCSGWEGVGPTRYGRQEFWNVTRRVLDYGHCIGSQ